uniref:EGF-like domain-containing protein n=1 Tax=Globodera rostochiensis TaxID=31243 RepID=A0A914HMH4_GLORO
MDLLMILCCLGGSPFIDFGHSPAKFPPALFDHQWDPTDWVATDLSGSLLNASASSSLVASNPKLKELIPADLPAQLSLEQCDLWNLTFASNSDENVFRRSRGRLKCRCPIGFFGTACQHPPAVPSGTGGRPSPSFPRLPMAQRNSPPSPSLAAVPLLVTATASVAMALEPSVGGISRNENSFALYLLVFMLLAVAMASLFAMLRGCCFCDCFGGFRRRTSRGNGNDADDDKPLEAATVNRCLEAVKAYEQEKHRRWQPSAEACSTGGGALWVDSRRPLIPSVSESVQHQTRQAPPPARPCSPPPSYRSLNNSMERLSDNTKM